MVDAWYLLNKDLGQEYLKQMRGRMNPDEQQKLADVRRSLYRSDIFEAVVKERDFQDSKYGVSGHSIGAWLLIMEAELNEAKEAAIKPKTGRDNVISEIIQCMAVCMACLEQHGVEPIDGRQV